MLTNISKYLLLLLATFAAAEGLVVVETNDDIEMYRTDVRWYEFELMNTLEIPLESVRIEVRYPDGVRPLRDEEWKGKTGISHAIYAEKDTDRQRIIVELPIIAANSSEEMWFAFVGKRYGVYNFSTQTYLSDDQGEWRPSAEVIPDIMEEYRAAQAPPETIVETVVVKKEIPAEPTKGFSLPEIKSEFDAILLAALIGINIVLVILVVYALLRMRKVRRVGSSAEKPATKTVETQESLTESKIIEEDEIATRTDALEPTEVEPTPEEEVIDQQTSSEQEEIVSATIIEKPREGEPEKEYVKNPVEESEGEKYNRDRIKKIIEMIGKQKKGRDFPTVKRLNKSRQRQINLEGVEIIKEGIEPEEPSDRNEPIASKGDITAGTKKETEREETITEKQSERAAEKTTHREPRTQMESLFDRLERAEREIKRDIFDTLDQSSHQRLAELILDNELLKTRLRLLHEMREEESEE